MMEEESDEITFNIVKNYPTERRYIRLKELSSSFMDNFKRVFGRG